MRSSPGDETMIRSKPSLQSDPGCPARTAWSMRKCTLTTTLCVRLHPTISWRPVTLEAVTGRWGAAHPVLATTLRASVADSLAPKAVHGVPKLRNQAREVSTAKMSKNALPSWLKSFPTKEINWPLANNFCNTTATNEHRPRKILPRASRSSRYPQRISGRQAKRLVE